MKTNGVLLHISSLPSPYGIGTLGKAAYDFVDFLSESHQKYWQILPICPTGFGDSPYQSFSSFAGNPYFIDLDELASEGYLTEDEYMDIDWGTDDSRVDYGRLSEFRISILRKAANRLLEKGTNVDFDEFKNRNSYWLDEYSVFMTLKAYHDNVSWLDWKPEYRSCSSDSVKEFAIEYSQEISEWKAIQYLFFRQWNSLKKYAERNGIKIIGDMPIYVSLDSADVWAHPELFKLDENNLPVDVSGCPPDGFSDDGQLWGNPIFDWEYIKNDKYTWWIRRIEYLSGIYHVLRIDHFRGFDEYYAIPYGAHDARDGVWKKGPGIDLFNAVEAKLGRLNIIAEDLGFLTDSVRNLLAETGFPGMKVLEMAFDHRDPAGAEYLPENYCEHCVAYVGTHDNDTAIGWLESSPKEDSDAAIKYLGLTNPNKYNWQMMEAIWKSDAFITIIQAQDILGLGSESRMNTPSVAADNWQWRLKKDALSHDIAKKLAQELKKFNRG